MNGPEHFREAERLLEVAAAGEQPLGTEWYANVLASAQVHATLAVAVGINPGLQYDQPDAHDPWRAEQ